MTGFETFMGHWGWVIFTLLASIISVISLVTNQYFKQPGHILVFWMRVMTVVVMTPFIFLFEWPTDPLFYIAVALTVPTGAFADIRLFNVAARHGGGVVARVSPLVIFLTFIVWFLFEPSLLKAYAEHPLNTAMVLLALAGCIYFSMHLSKCHISRTAFIEMLPALFGYTISTVFNKFAMDHGPLTGAVFGYMYFQSLVAIPLVGAYAYSRQKKARAKPLFPRHEKLMICSLLMTFAWVASMPFRNYAMAFTPNPSYVAAIGQTTPVFIAIFYWFAKHKEEADVASGMGIVACAALLALVTV